MAVAAALVASYAVRNNSQGIQNIFVDATIIVCECVYVLCVFNATVNYIIPAVGSYFKTLRDSSKSNTTIASQ